jgi:hypothetical protein
MSALPTKISALCYKSVSPSIQHIPYTIRTRERHVYIRAQKQVYWIYMNATGCFVSPLLPIFFPLCQLPFRLTFSSILVIWYTNRFNNQKPYILPRLYLCVFYLSQNKQRQRPTSHKLLGFYKQHEKCFYFNCCLSVHVDNYTIIVPTKCTSFLLKAQDISICTFCLCILSPYTFQSTRAETCRG